MVTLTALSIRRRKFQYQLRLESCGNIKRPSMSQVVVDLKECLATEYARTKHSRVGEFENPNELMPDNSIARLTPSVRLLGLTRKTTGTSPELAKPISIETYTVSVEHRSLHIIDNITSNIPCFPTNSHIQILGKVLSAKLPLAPSTDETERFRIIIVRFSAPKAPMSPSTSSPNFPQGKPDWSYSQLEHGIIDMDRYVHDDQVKVNAQYLSRK
ncbi:hypothetical protein ACE6H2_009952 [Prunus campanulata]